MQTFNRVLLLLLATWLGVAPAALADKDKDKDKNGQAADQPATAARYSGSGPTPGSCSTGRAQKDLDVNNVQARLFNSGSLFYSPSSSAIYLVPKESGNSAIYASGIWIGGRVGEELRVAGSRYDNFEFWPGPLGDDARPLNPSDCSEYDRLYKVSRTDILNYEGGLPPAADLRDWPVEFGAPVIAASDNLFDDDGDGVIDEGTNGLDDDGDGRVDERDEQERVNPDVRAAAGASSYDLAAGDRPDIIGDQGIWWVMNDVGNQHQETGSNPIGVEVRVLAWAFNRADALGNTTFYKYTVVYKGEDPLEDTYLSVFSDPDLGSATDDYVGSDTTLSLGFVYNAQEEDATYGIPPAAGYDFFQGPIVDGDTLGLTTYMYFINGTIAGQADPGTAQEYYNVMQGLWKTGVPLTESGVGYETPGPVTKFAFPGDPVTNECWSEVNPAQPMDGTCTTAEPLDDDDRRLVVTTGPFTLNPGDAQDIVFGLVFGQGSSNLNSIEVLKAADLLAQAAYDADFELPNPPPAPPLCNATSQNAELQPGSGNCLEAAEVSGEAALVWGYPSNSSNYLGGFDQADPLLAGQILDDNTYTFEGFNVYRYPNSNFDSGARELVATYDRVNGVTRVVDLIFNADVSDLAPVVTARGTDSGLEYFYRIPNLTNNQDYYYGISAYAFSPNSTPQILESSVTNIVVRPSDVASVEGGASTQSDINQGLTGQQVAFAGGAADPFVRVVDPTEVVDATYTIEFYDVVVKDGSGEPSGESYLTYNISRDGNVIFNGQERGEQTNLRLLSDDGTRVDAPIVIDGLQFFSVNTPAAFAPFEGDDEQPPYFTDGIGIVEVANPNSDVCAEDDADGSCGLFGGNAIFQDLNSTEDYYITGSGNSATVSTIARFAEFYDPENIEVRFTEECDTSGTCLGVRASAIGGDNAVVSVPFELWNTGDQGTTEDDVRMIPLIGQSDPAVVDWKDYFPTTDRWAESPCLDPEDEDSEGCPITDDVFALMPDRTDGYDQFAAAARGFGGLGATYDPEADGDDQIDPNPDEACGIQGYYIDWCYNGGNPLTAAFIRTVYADASGDGTTPDVGVVNRFITKKPRFVAGERFVFDTSSLAFVTGNAEDAARALDMIAIVPNPYRGRSEYEAGTVDRRVRFTNVPPVATMRIYTVSGTLIRTLTKEGPARSLDWDLTTESGLPVASGMYLIHVDAAGSDGTQLGERVLKFGVINRQFQLEDLFRTN